MTPQLTRAMAALRREFAAEIEAGLIVHLGTTNCRRKNNKPGAPWSEHSWPNAVDVMLKRIPGTRTPTPGATAVGYRVAAWMRAHPELWAEVYWQVAGHYDHVHGTAAPRMNHDNKQVPPCAGPTPTGGGEGGPKIQEEADLAILTDDEQRELQKFLEALAEVGSNVRFVPGLIKDMRKNIITRDELTAALADLPANGSTEATIAEIRRRLS